MKTRSGRNHDLRGLCMGALSAASIGLLGLGLANQSLTMLATANSALSPSAQTALRGGKDKVDKAGSSEEPVIGMTLVPIEFPFNIEREALQEAHETMKLVCAQFFYRALGMGKSPQGNLPVASDEGTKRWYMQRLQELKLTPKEVEIASDTEDCRNYASFDCLDPKGEPKSESEVMKGAGDVSSSSYKTKLTTLFADTEYQIARLRERLNQQGNLFVNRPMTMIARFRSRIFPRCIVFTLPYNIDQIAAQFRCSKTNYFFDVIAALPEMQMSSPSPIGFTYVTAYDNVLASTEVKLGEKGVVTWHQASDIITYPSFSAKDFPQVIKKIKEEAKIPQNHKLVIAYAELLDPKTGAKTCGLSSDLTIIDNLRGLKGFPESVSKFEVEAQILDVVAIYVDCEYSVIMQDHFVETFNMLEDFPIFDEKLKTQSACLLDKMKKAVQRVADKK